MGLYVYAVSRPTSAQLDTPWTRTPVAVTATVRGAVVAATALLYNEFESRDDISTIERIEYHDDHREIMLELKAVMLGDSGLVDGPETELVVISCYVTAHWVETDDV